MIESILLGTGVTLILYGIYKWMTINNAFFEKRGIPHLKSFLCFGNTFGFFGRVYNPYQFSEKLYRAFPNEKIIGLFDFRQPLFLVRDPEMLKQMCIKDFDNFEDHRSFIDGKVDKLFGNGLFMLSGEKWRDMRSTLSPVFTGSKMRQMFELVLECAHDMTNHFVENASKSNSNEIDCEMKEVFGRYTNDVIATSAFGIKINSFVNRQNEFYVTGRKVLDINKPLNSLKLILLKTVPSVMGALDIELVERKVSNYFRSIVFGTMQIREEKEIYRPDMINIMMEVKKGNFQQNLGEDRGSVDGFATVEESKIGKRIVKRLWNDDEIVAQCFLFFVAGFDASSSALAFAMYELALNSDVQQRLYNEVMETQKKLDNKMINYDMLQRMQYLDMVVSETLRLWPSGGFSDRLCVKDYRYDDGIRQFTIPKGVSFWVPIYSLHHDESYFPNPNQFDPERFSGENRANIVPGAYIPFGIGPRNCIGSRFALMELKAVMYCLLRRFEFRPTENTQIPIKFKNSPFGITTERGIELKLVLRD